MVGLVVGIHAREREVRVIILRHFPYNKHTTKRAFFGCYTTLLFLYVI